MYTCFKRNKEKLTNYRFCSTGVKRSQFNFRKNEFAAILGLSGSGKTMLLNIIRGLYQYDEDTLVINK